MNEPRTEGQRLLLAVNASLAAIAEAVGCSKPIVSYWRRGLKVPGPDARKKLLAAYAIPIAAWELAPGARAVAAHPEEADDDEELVELDDTAALVNERIRALRRRLRRKDLSETARARLEDTYAKQLALRARHERDVAIALDMFLRGPEWARLKEALLSALRPFPEAARAAGRALQELEA